MYRAGIEERELQNALRAQFFLCYEFLNSSVYIGLFESVNFQYYKIQPRTLHRKLKFVIYYEALLITNKRTKSLAIKYHNTFSLSNSHNR